MIINDVPFAADLSDIITELRSQLAVNGSTLLSRVRDTPLNIMVSCPYHNNGQERRPSAGIHKETGVFHCFACGETHSLQEVISHVFGRDDDIVGAFGWEWLLKNFLTINVEERKDIDLDFARAAPNDTFRLNNSTFVSEEELDSYRYYHPYMYKRKMTNDIIDIFDIGFDAKTNCITFPVRDIRGNTLFVARRSVVTKFFNYPAGVMKPVYGLFEYSTHNTPEHKPKWDADEVIICESMIDAITCWVYGKYAVALNGLGNELQFNQLKAMPCRKFILGTDNDEAGMKARIRIKANLKNKLITEYMLPDGRKDINDLSKEEFDNLKEVISAS